MENIALGKQPDNAEGLSSRGMDKAAIAFHKCGYRNKFLYGICNWRVIVVLNCTYIFVNS